MISGSADNFVAIQSSPEDERWFYVDYNALLAVQTTNFHGTANLQVIISQQSNLFDSKDSITLNYIFSENKEINLAAMHSNKSLEIEHLGKLPKIVFSSESVLVTSTEIGTEESKLSFYSGLNTIPAYSLKVQGICTEFRRIANTKAELACVCHQYDKTFITFIGASTELVQFPAMRKAEWVDAIRISEEEQKYLLAIGDPSDSLVTFFNVTVTGGFERILHSVDQQRVRKQLDGSLRLCS